MPNPLSLAIDRHNLNEVINALNTTNINEEIDGFSPLERAVLHGNTEIAEYLLRRGANIHVNDRQILVYAVRSVNNNVAFAGTTVTQMAEMVELLLRWGADPNGIKRNVPRNDSRFDRDERSALIYAVWNHSHSSTYEGVIKHLLGAGADRDYRATGRYNQNARMNALETARRLSQPAEKIAIITNYHNYPNIRGRILVSSIQQNDKTNLNDLEKRMAISTGSAAAGAFILVFSVAMLIADKNDSNAYKLFTLGFVLITLSGAIAGHETSKLAKSAGYRLHFLFAHMEANASRVSESIIQTNLALQEFSETTAQAVTRLSQTIDESIVILRDEARDTFVELRGRGKDVAAAIQEGIRQNRFKPEVNVNASVFAAAIRCQIF